MLSNTHKKTQAVFVRRTHRAPFEHTTANAEDKTMICRRTAIRTSTPRSCALIWWNFWMLCRVRTRSFAKIFTGPCAPDSQAKMKRANNSVINACAAWDYTYHESACHWVWQRARAQLEHKRRQGEPQCDAATERTLTRTKQIKHSCYK